jgi:hypothetical protein
MVGVGGSNPPQSTELRVDKERKILLGAERGKGD